MQANLPRPSASSTPSPLTLYLADIRRRNVLSREEEQRVALRAREGCHLSRNKLVVSNLGFVVRVAKSYRNMGLPFEDLLNEGNLGLIEAAARYRPTVGVRFLTYAVWWIRKSMLEALAMRGNLIRIPSSSAEKARRDGVSPTRRLGLDDPVHELSDVRIGDSLIDPLASCPEQEYAGEQARRKVWSALQDLDRKQRHVLIYRYGLDGGRPLTLRQVGDRMGISRERARQIEEQAIRRIRRAFVRARVLSSAAAPLR